MGMLGGIGANLAAKEMDDQTPVRIVTSNDEGSVVEVTDGPFKGVTGFRPAAERQLMMTGGGTAYAPSRPRFVACSPALERPRARRSGGLARVAERAQRTSPARRCESAPLLPSA